MISGTFNVCKESSQQMKTCHLTCHRCQIPIRSLLTPVCHLVIPMPVDNNPCFLVTLHGKPLALFGPVFRFTEDFIIYLFAVFA